MSDPRKLYWDSSCFICFLNKDEAARRLICEDVLYHAQNHTIEIWTSTWTIVEVIRPKRHGSAPLPLWAAKAIEAIEKTFPESRHELETLWHRYQSSDPATKLTPEQISKIQKMFEWPFVQKINLDQRVANEAVRLARDCGLKPADSVHAASAILKKVDALQKWDRDFSKVGHLITVEEPQRISTQNSLLDLLIDSPTPASFEVPTVQMALPPAVTEVVLTGTKQTEDEKTKPEDDGKTKGPAST